MQEQGLADTTADEHPTCSQRINMGVSGRWGRADAPGPGRDLPRPAASTSGQTRGYTSDVLL